MVAPCTYPDTVLEHNLAESNYHRTLELTAKAIVEIYFRLSPADEAYRNISRLYCSPLMRTAGTLPRVFSLGRDFKALTLSRRHQNGIMCSFRGGDEN